MNRRCLCGLLGLLSVLVVSGCDRSPATQLSPTQESTIEPKIETTATDRVLSHQIRLPVIKNGSELTPTPFLPLASTPFVVPTPVPQVELSSQVWTLKPVTPPVTPVPKAMHLLGDQATAGDDLINFLLIGSDKRSGAYFRTDTMVIASVRPRQQVVSLISIPRDLFVYIPGWTMQRINTAYLHGEMAKYPGGGTALVKDTILYNLGIRIDKTAIVDFDGFKKIVDMVDGVDVPLSCPYTDWHVVNPKGNLENPNNWRLYTAGPGITHMDGDLALWYARSRMRSNDFDRGRRQQEVLRAIYAKALQLGMLPHIPELYREMSEIVISDIGLEDILALAPMALSLDSPRIRSYYISSKYVKGWWTPQGASVLLPKSDKLQAMLQEAMLPPDDAEQDRLQVMIEIVNNTGKPGVEILAAERLHYVGFETEISPPTGEQSKKSWLYPLSGSAYVSQAGYILDSLGLPADRLIADSAVESQADFRLVLGKDYNPCFNPSKLNR